MAQLRCTLLAQFVCLTTFVSACDKKPTDQKLDSTDDERELLDPEEKKRDLVRRCVSPGNGQEVALRASGSGIKAAVEVGDAVAVNGGFAVAVLESGKESHVSVSFLDGAGASKSTELGRVHGAVDPPRLFSFGDGRVFVALVDNDAGHTRLRVARIDDVKAGSGVVWGPEVQVRRGETNTFSLTGLASDDRSHVLLAWDDFDKSTLRSQVRALTIDAQTMKPVGPQIALSPDQEDAGLPVIRPGSGGIWAAWVRYGDLEKGDPGAPGLVDEAPRSLRVRKLDHFGKSDSEPIDVSAAGENVVAYEAARGPEGEFILAYRTTAEGRQEGATPVRTRIVKPDGAIVTGAVENEDLGMGAPLYLSSPGAPLWLSARGYESDVLLGELDGQAVSSDFQAEGSLQTKIPLARRGQRLLVMRPDGLDLKLSVVDCSLGSQKTAPKGPPPAK